MTEIEAIEILRSALASVWTDLEYNHHGPDDLESQTIADEALRLTDKFARPRDITNDRCGLEAWRHCVDQYRKRTENR